MVADNSFFEEQFNIRTSEVGPDQKATLPAICNLLQEAAGNHAYRLQFDITDLQQQKLTWVLHRLQVQIIRFPHWRETITVRTWPSGSEGLRALRDFLLLDTDGQTIGRALSYWLILSMESRRPIRIPKEILDRAPEDRAHVLPVEKGDFTEVTSPDSSHAFRVRKADLDLNRHVNNVRYVEWMNACLPNNVDPKSMDIKFTGEAVLDDRIRASCRHDGQRYHLQVQRSNDRKLLAKAHIT